MNNKLMREFEEFEGLTGQNEEVFEIKEEDDSAFQPASASVLSSGDIYYELEKRGLKSTGFPDTDREMLQKAFDEEFKNDLEEMRAKRREKQRKAAQQAGLQKRRMLMEKTLQEEQTELARNHQLGMMIGMIRDNNKTVNAQLRLEINSVSARSLAKSMWTNDTVTCLDLSSNELNDHAGCYLARILKRNETIRKIELDNNNLGPKACVAFGESLLTNSSLVSLSLDSNPIATESDHSGIRSLSEALRANRTMSSLNLWRTGISQTAGSILASSVELNTTLLNCDVGQNGLHPTDIRRIVQALDKNLSNHESAERRRREEEMTEEEKQKRIKEQQDNEIKQEELKKWLQERRDQRAEEKRVLEEQNIIRIQEEIIEKKRLADLRAAEEKKAAEEAAAKKGKKKGKDKKK